MDSKWVSLLEDWYNEKGPSVRFFSGNSEPHIMDIVANEGFQRTMACYASGIRGKTYNGQVEINDDNFTWSYKYRNAQASIGGMAAYTPAIHFLGSYRAHIVASTSHGNQVTYTVLVGNLSGWRSAVGEEIYGILPPSLRYLIENCERKHHPCAALPLFPSLGGNMKEYFQFEYSLCPGKPCADADKFVPRH
jgi:hypothetical protein